MAYQNSSGINVEGIVTLDSSGSPTGSTVTEYGVLIGDASNAVASTAVGTSGDVLTSNGAGMAPTYQTPAAGTVTSVSGTTNRITSTGGSTPVIDISASYVGQSSITTLGTVTTGTWNGTDITVANGGTGRSTSTAYGVICGGTTSTAAQQSIASVGTSGQVLTSNGAAALPTFQSSGVVSPLPMIAYPSANLTNATGDGTEVSGVFNAAAVNTGSHYDTGTGRYEFSGAGTGTYLVNLTYRLFGCTASNYATLKLYLDGRSYSCITGGSSATGEIYITFNRLILISNSALNIQPTITVSGGTKIVSIYGASGGGASITGTGFTVNKVS